MTVCNTHRSTQALPYSEDNRGPDRRYPPASLLLGGTVLVMNVWQACSTAKASLHILM